MPEEKLTNIVTSTKPCPICASINGMTMTLAEWESSAYGLPGSDGRYCDGACHCILIPDSLLDKFDWIDPNYIPRGDEGSDVRPIIEIFPNEKALADLMNEWNARFGRLPQEIYKMSVKDGFAYLQKAFNARIAGGAAPIVPPPPAPIQPPAPVPPVPIPPSAPPQAAPAAKTGRTKGTGVKLTAAEMKVARTKAVFAGEPDSFIKAQVGTERKAWALNEKQKAGKGPARGHGREYAFAVNADGTITFFKKGKLSRVNYDWKEMYDSRNAVAWTHNHPTFNNVPNSFSPADAGFTSWGVDKHVVITAGKRYVMFKPAGGWYPGQAADVAALWKAYETKGEYSVEFQSIAGKITSQVHRIKNEYQKIWDRAKPSDAALDQIEADARLPYMENVKALRAEYDRMMKDLSGTPEDRQAAWRAYADANNAMAKVGGIARERAFYAALDKAAEEFMRDAGIRYVVEDWD